jgi:hypothetical protein
MTLGHISTVDLSPFQSSISKNIEFSENFLSQVTFVDFNMNYETYVKIHKTNNKIYILDIPYDDQCGSLLFTDAMLAFYP